VKDLYIAINLNKINLKNMVPGVLGAMSLGLILQNSHHNLIGGSFDNRGLQKGEQAEHLGHGHHSGNIDSYWHGVGMGMCQIACNKSALCCAGNQNLHCS